MFRNVAIMWDDLIGAFSNMEESRLYFLDRLTGEIFSVRADSGEQVMQHMEQDNGRFIEIPPIDRASEKEFISGFIEKQEDIELKELLEHAVSCRPPYAKPSDIISFFPDEEAKMAEMRDTFLSERVKNWLEENNLLSISTSLNAVH